MVDVLYVHILLFTVWDSDIHTYVRTYVGTHSDTQSCFRVETVVSTYHTSPVTSVRAIIHCRRCDVQNCGILRLSRHNYLPTSHTCNNSPQRSYITVNMMLTTVNPTSPHIVRPTTTSPLVPHFTCHYN